MRKTIYISGLIISFLIFVSLNIVIYFLFFSSHDTSALLTLTKHPWWFQYKTITQTNKDLYYYTGTIYLFNIGIILMSLYLFRKYRKTDSAEIFFLIIFFLFMSFGSFKPLNAYIYTLEVPFVIGTLITRIIFFGNISALLSLFFCSLYPVKLKYQKFGIVLSVIILAAFVLSASIPIDPTVFLANFYYKLGIEHSLWFFIYILYLVILSNFVYAFVQSRNKHYIHSAIAVFFILAGFLIYYFAIDLRYLIPSILLIMTGAYLFTRHIDKIYIPF
ncbi:MAG: hypothetical protein GXP33_01440 [Spirochaetes bacterium]|nr:hypothetical protein [Spirochaetota bacterium]